MVYTLGNIILFTMGAREDMLARIAAAKNSNEAAAEAQANAEKAAEQEKKNAAEALAAKQERMANLHNRVRDALRISNETLGLKTAEAWQTRESLLGSQNELLATQAEEDEALFNAAAAEGVEMNDDEKNEVVQEAKRNIKGGTKEAIKTAHAEWKGNSHDAKLVSEVSQAFDSMNDEEKLALDDAMQSGNLDAVKQVAEAYKARNAEIEAAEKATSSKESPEALMTRMEKNAKEMAEINAEIGELSKEMTEVSAKIKNMTKDAESQVDARFAVSPSDAQQLVGQYERIASMRDQHYAAHATAIAEALNTPEGEAAKARYRDLHEALVKKTAEAHEVAEDSTAAARSFLKQTAEPIGVHSKIMGGGPKYAEKDRNKIPSLPPINIQDVDPLRNRNKDLGKSYLERSSGDYSKEAGWQYSYSIVNPGTYNYGIAKALE